MGTALSIFLDDLIRGNVSFLKEKVSDNFRSQLTLVFRFPSKGITRPRHEYYGNRYGTRLPKLAVSNHVENFGSLLLSS